MKISTFTPACRMIMATVATIASTTGLAVADETLTAVMHSPLRTLDPYFTTGHITRNHGYMIYDTLLAQDENFEPRPQMASWEISDDKLVYTFTLRDGLKFHDGANVTAEDVIASLKRWAEVDKGGQIIMQRTASIEATDEKTITWTLNEPFGPMLTMLSKQSTMPTFIMPKEVAEVPASETITDYTGSGPFKFVEKEFVPGVVAVYEKFEEYIPRQEETSNLAGGKKVFVDRVEWVNMPDAQTSLSALITGEIDYVERIPVDYIPLAEQENSIVVEVREPIGSMTMARMNFIHPPFDNKLVRQAALKAITQEPILAAMVGDPEYYKTCGAVLGCGMPLGSEDGAQSLIEGSNTEEAKELLQQAGYDGTPIVLLQPTDVTTLSTQPVVIAQQLKAAGFTVDLQAMDWQSVLARVASTKPPSEGGWNMYVTNWIVPEAADPISFNPLDGNGDEGWVGWPDDPEIESLKAELIDSVDPEARKEAAEKIQKHAIDNVLLVPLGQFVFPQARRGTVSDMIPSPVPVFWNMKEAEE